MKRITILIVLLIMGMILGRVRESNMHFEFNEVVDNYIINELNENKKEISIEKNISPSIKLASFRGMTFTYTTENGNVKGYRILGMDNKTYQKYAAMANYDAIETNLVNDLYHVLYGIVIVFSLIVISFLFKRSDYVDGWIRQYEVNQYRKRRR